MAIWLNRATLEQVNLSPAKMARRFPADAPFVDAEGLAISNAAWLYAPDLAAVSRVGRRFWILDGDVVREMTTAEKNARVARWKALRLDELKAAANDYGVEQGFDEILELRLSVLHIRARLDGLTNRAAHIGSAVAWQAQILGHYRAKMGEIVTARTFADVQAVAWNFAQFDASRPDVTVASALAISD